MEKIPTKIVQTAEQGALFVAEKIKALILENQKNNKKTVLGLATGATPVLLYRVLVQMHLDGLSFKNVITFNLDEYYPLTADAQQSYHRFMDENLFNHIDIDRENINIPDGSLALEKVEDFCDDYESKIDEVGGIDIQILGIGRTGHIGFNEPGSSPKSLTRLVTLDKKTRMDAAGDFRNEENVPRTAITMGVGTIFKAKKIYIMAWGENKSKIVAKAVEGPVTWQVPATFLQSHSSTTFIIDDAASTELERVKTPWLVESCDWDWKLTLKAVCWLSSKLEKPVLKLTDENYSLHGMGDLISKSGSAYELNLKVFRHLRDTITGWPGGKPGTHDERRPERAEPFPKKSLVFSAHPEDDVISMGGTLIRLVDQGHDVHVAYQTSGNVGVKDDDVLNQLNFVKEFASFFSTGANDIDGVLKETKSFFMKKNAATEDLESIKHIKNIIRKVEAKSSCRHCGVNNSNIHFMNLPFYETGKKQKKQFNEVDVDATVKLLQKLKPHQIFVAGDQIDPNGTYKICFDIVVEALKRLKTENWISDCWLWLYRGTKHEWQISEIDMAVPLSPEEMVRKRHAIIKHKSQKDIPVFADTDPREAWQRAEDKNKHTAMVYDSLGLPEYEGVEAFRRFIY